MDHDTTRTIFRLAACTLGLASLALTSSCTLIERGARVLAEAGTQALADSGHDRSAAHAARLSDGLLVGLERREALRRLDALHRAAPEAALEQVRDDLASIDAEVRSAAVRCLHNDLSDAATEALLERLRVDGSAAVRGLCVDLLAARRNGRDAVRDGLEHAARSDPSALLQRKIAALLVPPRD